MNATVLGVVLGVVVAAITAVGGWLTARAGRRASPYEALSSRVNTLERQHSEDRVHIDAQAERLRMQGRRIDKLCDQLDQVVADRDNLVHYIIVREEWLRNGAPPPPPPMPTHLRDVMPAGWDRFHEYPVPMMRHRVQGHDPGDSESPGGDRRQGQWGSVDDPLDDEEEEGSP